MSGAVSIGVAAIAIGTAAATGFETFAVIAAVGATIGAVGAVTKVKELQYAGAAIGAVGLVGGLASAGGLFDGASDLFGAASGGSFGASGAGELGLAGSGAGAASDTGGWAGVSLSDAGVPFKDVGSMMDARGIAAGELPDAITMANGGQIPTGMPQNVTPTVTNDTIAGQVLQSNVPSAAEPGAPPTTQNVLQSSVPSADTTPPPPPTTQDFSSPVTGRVQDPTESLLNGGQTPIDVNGRFSPIPTDQKMTLIPQGDGEGGTLGTTNNPAALPDQTIAPVTGRTGVPSVDQPSALGGTPAPSGPYQATMGSGASTPTLGLQAGATQPTSPISGADPSTWKSIGDFIKNNQMLSYGAIQTAGSFLSGALSPLMPAQVAELESRQKQNEAAAALYNQQAALLQKRLSNMSAPMPIATRSSLLNGGMAVTGRPA